MLLTMASNLEVNRKTRNINPYYILRYLDRRLEGLGAYRIAAFELAFR